MIAIGGAIGTGLFLGAGGRLAAAGPALLAIYAVCGFFGFLVLRALGELVVHRPSSGSFVSYAREFFGEKAAFTAGWLYWLNWAMTSVVDITAVALYMNFFKKYWAPIAAVPQWTWALAALVDRVEPESRLGQGLRRNGVLVRVDKGGRAGHIPVSSAPTSYLRDPVGGARRRVQLITDNGGWLPNGLLPAVIITQGVVFAYAGIELIGTTAGETAEPKKVIPKAINTVIFRIAVFYVGSILLLSLLLPYSMITGPENMPFVTFFGSIGVQGADAIMNLVVLTAALSLAERWTLFHGADCTRWQPTVRPPRYAGRMSKAGVPYGGIAITAVVDPARCGASTPSSRASAFEIVLNVAALGILASWATIVAVPDQAGQLGTAGVPPASRLPDVRRSIHVLPDAAVPAGCRGADRIRLPRRHIHDRFTRGDHPYADPGVVRLPRPHRGDRRSARRVHRTVPGCCGTADRRARARPRAAFVAAVSPTESSVACTSAGASLRRRVHDLLQSCSTLARCTRMDSSAPATVAAGNRSRGYAGALGWTPTGGARRG